MDKVKVLQNSFIDDALGYLRNEKTSTKEFRYYSDRLCNLLISNVLSPDDLNSKEIQTPVSKINVKYIDADFVIVSILRAGIAMLQPAIHLLPDAKVGFAGIFRDEKTALPQEYFWKMPPILSTTTVLILDPMLATGGSGLHVIRKISDMKPKEIRFVSIIAAPEGITAIHKDFPDLTIFTASIDDQLNDKKFIVPGLGDYGDRYFGTPS